MAGKLLPVITHRSRGLEVSLLEASSRTTLQSWVSFSREADGGHFVEKSSSEELIIRLAVNLKKRVAYNIEKFDDFFCLKYPD